MDAMAVAAARGLAAKELRVRDVALVAGFFGGFQAGMPLLGYLLGQQFAPLVDQWSHWIGFALLAAIGGKMIHEAWGESDKPEGENSAPDSNELFGVRVLLVLAVATSIDAFAVGITLPMIGAPFVVSLVTIGITTAVLSALGLFAGRKFGSMLGRRLDAFGGIVLVGMGIKVLADHFL